MTSQYCFLCGATPIFDNEAMQENINTSRSERDSERWGEGALILR